MVQLMNQGNRSSLLQRGLMMAIRHYHQKKFRFLSFNATSGKNRGKFRAASKNQNMPNKLPTNKESIFYLNVLDIHQIVQSKKVRMH